MFFHFDSLFSLIGLFLFAWRLKPWVSARAVTDGVTPPHLVSIIIPCRNEELNLKNLLPSLLLLKGVNFEVIVVDDSSSDRTLEVARSYSGVQVLEAGLKPESWVGKSWACWQGVQAARGNLVLFTDADTIHNPESLKMALEFFSENNASLISAPPYHRAVEPFEKILGLFHLIPLVATAYQHRPSTDRVYAIGQYLLTSKQNYFECGGHKRISSSLVDDIDLAKLYLESGFKYAVYPKSDLYQVQMYQGLIPFILGWKRLLRLGSKRAGVLSFLETVAIIHLFWQPFWAGNGASWLALLLLMWAQRQHGAFSVWGVLLAPVSILVFVMLSIWGFAEGTIGRKVIWHERSYQDS